MVNHEEQELKETYMMLQRYWKFMLFTSMIKLKLTKKLLGKIMFIAKNPFGIEADFLNDPLVKKKFEALLKKNNITYHISKKTGKNHLPLLHINKKDFEEVIDLLPSLGIKTELIKNLYKKLNVVDKERLKDVIEKYEEQMTEFKNSRIGKNKRQHKKVLNKQIKSSKKELKKLNKKAKNKTQKIVNKEVDLIRKNNKKVSRKEIKKSINAEFDNRADFLSYVIENETSNRKIKKMMKVKDLETKIIEVSKLYEKRKTAKRKLSKKRKVSYEKR